jgi:hypothetical protein
LDETLVHSSLDPDAGSPLARPHDFFFPVQFEDATHTVYVRRRPGVQVRAPHLPHCLLLVSPTRVRGALTVHVRSNTLTKTRVCAHAGVPGLRQLKVRGAGAVESFWWTLSSSTPSDTRVALFVRAVSAQVVLFTASHPSYANPLLDILDPEGCACCALRHAARPFCVSALLPAFV